MRSRKGWCAVEPSIAARRAVETGLPRNAALRAEGRPLQLVIRRLRGHIADEQKAIAEADAPTRAFLLAVSHVCLARSLGPKLPAGMLRDLTARTMMVAALYQSTPDARALCADHAGMVDALEELRATLAPLAKTAANTHR